MVGQRLYDFPIRPFPGIFSFNLLFTLVGLPVCILVFLRLIEKRGRLERAAIIVLFSMVMAIFEKKAEAYGMFVHSKSWSHHYTFSGYCVFLSVVQWFHTWIKVREE
jgi:glucan phosphoethanolaminetransferase (alkaline phosphatase superfamily)